MIDILHTQKKTVWMHCNRNYPMLECNNWNDHRNESLAMLKSNAHMQIKCLFYRSFWTHRITAHFFFILCLKANQAFFVGLDSILSFFVRLVYLFSCLEMTTKTPLDFNAYFFFLFLTIILTLSDNQKLNTKKRRKVFNREKTIMRKWTQPEKYCKILIFNSVKCMYTWIQFRNFQFKKRKFYQWHFGV